MNTSSESPIEFDRVSKTYGLHRVLTDMSVRLRRGSVTALLGPNGSGKTTALRVLLGLERADSGEARIDGRRMREVHAPYQHVGALLDASWIHPERSARDHLSWIARASCLPLDVVQPSLDTVGLTAVADQKAGVFSLGMRQRLGIASTLLGDPHVLVFDEPLNGLDHEGVEWVRSFFLEQAERGRTVLLSSHLLAEVELTADELVVLGQGSVLYTGRTVDLADDRPAVEFDVDDQTATTDAIRQLADSLGWHLERTGRRRGRRTYAVNNSTLAEVSTVLGQADVRIHRIQDRGSLEEAYARMTEQRADFRGLTRAP